MHKVLRDSIYRGISVGMAFIVLLLGVGGFTMLSSAWFASNEQVEAGGMTVTVHTSNIEVIAYRYTGNDLEKVTTLALDATGQHKETAVFFIKRSATPEDEMYKLTFENFSLCYNGLQSPTTFTSGEALDAFITPYRLAGDYSYTKDGMTHTLPQEEVTTADYLRFNKPISNAINVKSAFCAITGEHALNDETAIAYVVEQLGLGEAGTLAFGASRGILYDSDYTITQDDILGTNGKTALEPTDYHQLSDNSHVVGATDGFPVVIDDIALSDAYYAVAVEFSFDFDAASTANLLVDGVEREVTCHSSNPYMYQTFIINTIAIREKN